MRRFPGPAPRPFDEITLTRLTSDGHAGLAVAVSPDGRYVAHAFVEQGREGLRVRQVDTSATVQVVPPADVQIYGVTFTPDGNRLCYVAYPRGSGTATLFEVPVLGGPPRKLLEDVDRDISFAPDGTRFAFLRGLPGTGSAIVVANADGTGERTLVERRSPSAFVYTNVAWSPDGKVIAAATYDGQLLRVALVAVDAATGAVQPIGSRRWESVSGLRWLPGAAGLIAATSDWAVSSGGQIWTVEYPAGTARRITNDLAGYSRLSLSADARTLVTTRVESRGSLWVGPAGQPDRPARVAGIPDTLVAHPIRWTTDGRILYTANTDGNDDIWTTLPVGTLLLGSYFDYGEGRTRIAMVRADGGGAPGRLDVRLTLGSRFTMAWAPDGRAITYVRVTGGAANLWRQPIDGGPPTQVTHYTGGDLIAAHAWSPDGKLLAMVRAVTARDVVVIRDVRR